MIFSCFISCRLFDSLRIERRRMACLTSSSCVSAAEAGHDAAAVAPPPDRPPPGPRRAAPREHDMLTCGRCQTDFPLGDILVFIEHKRRLCRGARGGPGSFSKPGERGGASGIPIAPREPGRGATPVEVGVQVTPGREEDLERRLTPARGICPKQERGGTEAGAHTHTHTHTCTHTHSPNQLAGLKDFFS